jgi:alpha-L-fucosidase
VVAAREAGANAWQLHERAWNNEFAPERPWDPTVQLSCHQCGTARPRAGLAQRVSDKGVESDCRVVAQGVEQLVKQIRQGRPRAGYQRRQQVYENQLAVAKVEVLLWENCRGIGLSFGYNQVEDPRHLLSGPQVVRHLVDIVSRDGNLLLNIGPTASELIPHGQRRTLEALADWMATGYAAVDGSRPLDAAIAIPSDEPWVRWTRTAQRAWAVVDVPEGGPVTLSARTDRLELDSAALVDGTPVPARQDAQGITVELPAGPAAPVVGFALR